MSLRLFSVGDIVKLPSQIRLPDSAAVEAVTGSWRFRGPGVLVVNGNVVVVLPRGHPLPSVSDRLQSAIRLLACLAQYRREPRHRSVRGDQVVVSLGDQVDEQDELDSLEAALLLLEDWVANGPLVVTAIERGRDVSGRIHWQRSERLGSPLVSRTGILYSHFVVERVRARKSHPLVALHEAVCLNLAYRFGGWVVSKVQLPSRSDAQSILENQGRQVFSDRAKWASRLLRRFYRGHGEQGEQRRGLLGLIAPQFALVWERILQVALGHSPISGHWVGRYQLGSAQELGLHLRPDILVTLRNPHRVLVLDAKDYEKGTWPATSDISKQMLYRLLTSASTGLPLERIGNAFLFPGGAYPVRRIGNHRLLGDTPDVPGLATITCLEVNLPAALEAYRFGRVDRNLTEALVGEMAFDFPALRQCNTLIPPPIRQ